MSQIAFGLPDGKRSRHDVIDDFCTRSRKAQPRLLNLNRPFRLVAN
jgi:hypothetical protein